VLRILPDLIVLVLIVWSLVDCVTTPEEELRGLPKVLWVLLILLLPLVGALVYLLAGRPQRRRLLRASAPRVVGPDDDPEFLEELRRRHNRPERRDDEGNPS
jgi:hypothetical protein